MPQPDPDERFSTYPESGEDVLKKLLGAEKDEESEDEAEAPKDD